ncbi:hypothetical protein D3C80_404600 [compost metagenome]
MPLIERVSPMSGTNPQRLSIIDILVAGWAMRISAASANCMPAPRQYPSSAAITGTGSSCQMRKAF